MVTSSENCNKEVRKDMIDGTVIKSMAENKKVEHRKATLSRLDKATLLVIGKVMIPSCCDYPTLN